MEQPPYPQAKLTCMRELHHHYMQFFVSPVESLELGDWSVSPRLATIEREWNRYEEARVNDTNPELPATAEEFRDWFEMIAEKSTSTTTSVTISGTRQACSISRFSCIAEGKVESYFDDLMALAQIGSPMVTKMTIARNYWDEMGNGNHDATHTVMLDTTTEWMREHAIEPGFDLGMLEIPEAYANACELLMYSLRPPLPAARTRQSRPAGADGSGPLRSDRRRAQATGRAQLRLSL